MEIELPGGRGDTREKLGEAGSNDLVTLLGWKTSWADCRSRWTGQWPRRCVLVTRVCGRPQDCIELCHCRQSQSILLTSRFKATMPGVWMLGWVAPLVETTTDTEQGSEKGRYHEEGRRANRQRLAT